MKNDLTIVFESTSFDWMVVPSSNSPDIAQGTGMLNGAAGYKFRIWLFKGASVVRIQIFSETRRLTEQATGRMLQSIAYDSGVVPLSSSGCQATH